MADRDILPDYFKPAHYALVIDNLDFENWAYRGSVKIDGQLKNPTKEIVLNVLELTLNTAAVTVELGKGTQSWKADQITVDTKTQRATLVFPDELPVSAKATVAIEFNGIINHDMAGFYRSQYTPAVPPAASVPHDDVFHYMMSTQFEACDARRAFPCFDEPNLKATFDFAIEIPDDQVALSNMPVRETKSPSPSSTKPGRKMVFFERSPVMSTYLLAWAVGDFEYIEAFTERRYNGKPLSVRVYTTRGLVEQGRWALQHAPRIIDFFSERFGIDYPLPKSDILAAHEFTHGAMENWGLVTYRPTAILFDEERSDVAFRNRIAYVVAHELAHQWFGDLVTMDWWSELWLNEGFATWAGWLATDHLHPEYDVWSQFVNDGMEDAFSLDSVRASHAIQVPVRDALDVNQIFDRISYMKGCSVIRMLAAHLGIDTFLAGVGAYLKKHAYGNATTEALWAALSEASGRDVSAMMNPWITRVGFPVVTVEEPTPGQVRVRQSRFLTTGDVKPEDDETVWWLPLNLGAGKGEQQSLTTKDALLEVPIGSAASSDDDFYLVNAGATGFYRVNYPLSRLRALGGAQLSRLGTEDKIFITSSAAALAFAGVSSAPALLAFLQGLVGRESHYRVLNQALNALGTLKSIFGDDESVRKGLEVLARRLIDKPLRELGWEPRAGEDFNTSLLRKKVLLTAIANSEQSTIDEAYRRFTAHFVDPVAHPIHADLRLAIYRAAVRVDPAAAVKILKKEWFTTPAVDGKQICLQALGHAADATVVREVLLPFLFATTPPAPVTDAVPAGDVHYLAASLSGNRTARPLLWAHIRDNWSELAAKLNGNPIVLDRMIDSSLRRFADEDTLREIEAFFARPDIDTRGFDRTLGTVKDAIRARAAYRARDADALRAWAAGEKDDSAAAAAAA